MDSEHSSLAATINLSLMLRVQGTNTGLGINVVPGLDDSDREINVKIGDPPLVPDWHKNIEAEDGMTSAEKAEREKLGTDDVILAIDGEHITCIDDVLRVLSRRTATAIEQGQDSVPLKLRVKLCDVTIGCEEISLRCSVSLVRIKRAARGNRCTHRTVFDWWSLDKLRNTARKHKKEFLCPSCKNPIDRIVEVPEINALLCDGAAASLTSGVDKLLCKDLTNGATVYEPVRLAATGVGGASASSSSSSSSSSSTDHHTDAQHGGAVEILDVDEFDSPEQSIPEPAHIKKERQKIKKRRIEMAEAKIKAFDDNIKKQSRAEKNQADMALASNEGFWAYAGGGAAADDAAAAAAGGIDVGMALNSESASPKDLLISALEELMVADAIFRQRRELAQNASSESKHDDGTKDENEKKAHIKVVDVADIQSSKASASSSDVGSSSAGTAAGSQVSSSSSKSSTMHPTAPHASASSPSSSPTPPPPPPPPPAPTSPSNILFGPCQLVLSKSQWGKPIAGVFVHFPFKKPLGPQIVIMSKLITAFKSRSHALLESPTGTGKTAALLCAALAWQRHVGVKNGAQHRIIYCTRTHSQMDQVVNELRRTPYRPVMTVLASRKRLCIHTDVVGKDQSNFQITSICRKARRGGGVMGGSSSGGGDAQSAVEAVEAGGDVFSSSATRVGTCSHWKNLGEPEYAKNLHQQLLPGRKPDDTGGVIDIEELKEFGSAENGCPYFTSQALLQSGAQIVFCPYQYVVNPGMRETLGINVKGSVVIVDEAHNIEDTCREAGSIEISLFGVMNIIKDLCICDAHFIHQAMYDEGASARLLMAFFERVLRWLMEKRDVFAEGKDAKTAAEKIERWAKGDEEDGGAGGRGGSRSWQGRGNAHWLDPKCGLDMPVLQRGGGKRSDELHAIRANIAAVRQRIQQQEDSAVGPEEEAALSSLKLKRKREDDCNGAAAAAPPLESPSSTTPTHILLLQFRQRKLDELQRCYAELCQRRSSTCFNMLESELNITTDELERLGKAESEVFAGLDKLNGSFNRRLPSVTARAFREDGHKLLRVIRWAWQHPLEYYTVITADYNKKVPERASNLWSGNRGGKKKKRGGNNSQAHRESKQQPMHTHADFGTHQGVSCSRHHGPDYLLDDRNHPPQTPTWRVSLKIWLMTPAIVFEELSAQAHSVVLASGTLAPTASFRTELGADFASRITNSSSYEGLHVINAEKQLFASILTHSPKKWEIDGSFKKRAELKKWAESQNNSDSYVTHIGDCVYYALARIPADGGVLVFVPSYKILGEMEKRWENNGLIQGIYENRNGAEVVFEPRGGGQEAFENAKEQYMSAVNDGRGPVLVAVFRGKMSEGISFNDNYCRAVFCVGIPYPNVGDLNIKLKKHYNDMRSKVENGYIQGNRWYGLQAFRAVNQALGRCIRHLGDYGALFLVDSRYSSRKSQLAIWLRSHFVVHDSYRDMAVELGEFFDNVPQKLKDQAREAARKKNGGGGGDTAATAVVLVSSSESSSEAPNSSPAVANVATAAAAAGTSQPSQNAPADGSDPMDLDESV